MLLALSASWHSDSVTEQLAAERAARLLPNSVNGIYLAFDWHYQFEQINAGQQTLAQLRQQLAGYRNRWLGYSAVVTVCQHPDTGKYAALFAKLGITDVYVAGGVDPAAATQWQAQLHTRLRFSPFPLYVAPNTAVANKQSAFWQAFFAAEVNAVSPGDVAPLALPGDAALWQQLADTQQTPEVKTQALKQLRLLYGEQVLVSDIITQFCQLSTTGSARCALLQQQLHRYRQTPDPAIADFITTSLPSLALLEPQAFQRWIQMPQVSEVVNSLAKVLNRDSANRFTHLVPETGKPKRRYSVVGSHANRMPLAYAAYQTYFAKNLTHAANFADADVILISYIKDLEQFDAAQLQLVQDGKKTVVVLSEEPFWDVNWGGNFTHTHDVAALPDGSIGYCNINHLTSDVFNFDRLPYFITTEDHYFVRYCQLFQRNTVMTPAQWAAKWRDAEIDCALIAEKRLGEKFDLSFAQLDIFGLCRLRSLLAQHYFGSSNSLVAGMGWSKAPKRQRLPDWHLDKLALLDGRCRLVSALENTHVNNYLTEKLFDAFAVGAIPIYYAGPEHRVWDLVEPGSFINLYGLSAQQAIAHIAAFTVTDDFIRAYCATQQRLAALFRQPELLHQERSRVAAEVVRALKRVL